MNKCQLAYEDIMEILDDHIENEKNFLFVTDHNLATFISNYLAEEFDIHDALIHEGNDLDKNYEEYYISCWFDKDGERFYIESAKGHGGYKEVDNFDEPMDYYVFTNMDNYDVKRKLLGDSNCTWSWCELVEYEELKEEECNCQDCQEQRFFDLLADTMNRIIEAEGCPNCIMDALMEYSLEYQKNGFMIGRNR